MEFEITLTAKTSDKGGMKQSFSDQLEALNGENVEIVSEEGPYRVENGDKYYFEMRRTYKIFM